MTTGEPEPPHLAPPPDLPSYMIVPTPDRPDPRPPPEPALAHREAGAEPDGDTETQTISMPRHRHRASDPRAGDLPSPADRSLTALLAAVVVAVLVLAGGILIWLTHNPFASRSTVQAPVTQQTLLALLTWTVLAAAATRDFDWRNLRNKGANMCDILPKERRRVSGRRVPRAREACGGGRRGRR